MKPAWLEIAEKEIGTHEKVGGENPRILEYHKCTTLCATEDETPWCSAFVNWVMKQVGLVGTKSAAARSWLDWGEVLDEPRIGAIVILKRTGNPASGHVGFVYATYPGSIDVLGGNQSDQVKVSAYLTKTNVLGYRWPKGVK